MQQPFISVVIPAYNAAGTLDACLTSLARQTCGTFEAVCVDDGSADATYELLCAWAARDARVRVLHQQNAGTSAARNAGVAAARGEWVCFLDADDQFSPQALQRIAEVARAAHADNRPLDVVVFGGTFSPPQAATEWMRNRMSPRDAYFPQFSPALILDEATHPYIRYAIRRAFVQQQHIAFDEALHLGEDEAYAMALYPRAVGVQLIPDKLYCYTLGAGESLMDVAQRDAASKCAQDLTVAEVVCANWAEGGFLPQWQAQLGDWMCTFVVYALLRQPEGVRRQLVVQAKRVVCTYLPDAAQINAHRACGPLLLAVQAACDDGTLAMRERDLNHALRAWRLETYGLGDAVRAAAVKLKQKLGGNR